MGESSESTTYNGNPVNKISTAGRKERNTQLDMRYGTVGPHHEKEDPQNV